MKNNHICIFLAFEQIEIIKKAFESNYIDTIDWFIIENYSKNSTQIEEYFKNKNLKGYIQFEKNIAANAIDIFIKDFYKLLNEYDYITITDGDFLTYDANDMFKEIIQNLENSKAVISSGSLYAGNDYRLSNRLASEAAYIEYMKNKQSEPYGYNIKNTSCCFITLKKQNLTILNTGHFLDSELNMWVGGSWAALTKNETYHLTWDLYRDYEPYYEWKKLIYNDIWKKIEIANYRILK